MSDIAIRAEGLSKRYRIGPRQRYKALRDTLTEALYASARALQNTLGLSSSGHNLGEASEIWALKDVSFEVKRGAVLGVIGRNGAGKSTLLKILSRITEPTEGTVDVYGRVGSLLDVGTGFNPELTGRENIYLNGAILGMGRDEIARKFDEIVAFAEVEKFLDTPVKHYSSGMYMRLAFSVAAHLDSSILLVDEVLAVGDAEFQRKCFNKMQEVGHGGRTILFVSHNLSALRHICTGGLWLESGVIQAAGDIDSVADRYVKTAAECVPQTELAATHSFIINSAAVLPTNGEVLKPFDGAVVQVSLTARRRIRDPGLYVAFLSIENERLAALDFKDFATVPPMALGETREIGFVIKELPLLPGRYQLELYVKDMGNYSIEHVQRLFPFNVAEVPVYGGRCIDQWYGHVALRAEALTSPVELIHSR